MSISKRLALSSLIPLLIVFLGLGNIGMQSDQLLTNVTTLLVLLQFTSGLAPSIHDATIVEEHQLLVIMLLSVLSLLLGMAIVGWLVSSTLVRRLQRFHSVVQSVEHVLFCSRHYMRGVWLATCHKASYTELNVFLYQIRRRTGV